MARTADLAVLFVVKKSRTKPGLCLFGRFEAMDFVFLI